MIELTQIIDLLEVHPAVALHKAILLPGIEADALEALEAEWGTTLAPPLREFFLAHNGVALEWSLRQEDDPMEPVLRTEDDFPNMMEEIEDYGRVLDGRLVIAPLEEILVTEYDPSDVFDLFGSADGFFEHLQPVRDASEAGGLAFGDWGYVSEEDFRAQLRYFDLFDRDTGVVLLLEKDNPDPPVLYEPVRGGGYRSDRQMPWSQYLELVVQHFASVWRRDLFFRSGVEVAEELNWMERMEEILAFCRGVRA